MFACMIIFLGIMTHGLCAMEPKEPKEQKSRGRTISLSLPSLTLNNRPLSSSNSPKRSPNLSNSPSPNLSPRNSPILTNSPKDTIKISPKKISKSELKEINYRDIFENLLWQAVRDGETEKALSLIQSDMNIVDPSLGVGKTILIMAIKNGNTDIVQALLSTTNIDVNLPDKNGNTPLHHAILVRNEAVIKLLLYDYRVDSLRKNNGRFLAEKSTDHEFYSSKKELKDMILLRVILDTLVAEKASALQHLPNDVLDEEISKIKNAKLQLPQYATDEFIRKMLAYRIDELKLKNKIASLFSH